MRTCDHLSDQNMFPRFDKDLGNSHRCLKEEDGGYFDSNERFYDHTQKVHFLNTDHQLIQTSGYWIYNFVIGSTTDSYYLITLPSVCLKWENCCFHNFLFAYTKFSSV